MWLSEPSQLRLRHYVEAFPQSELLAGESGIGFAGAVEWIATRLQVKPYWVWPEKDGTVDREHGRITIERIRSLYDVTKTRSARAQLVVIDDADRMSTSAQNAFLKLLEEPSESVHFLLVTHAPDSLLPTVRSRVVTMRLTPITKVASAALLDSLSVKDVTKRQQLLFIAEGLPALLTQLAGDDKQFQHRAQIVRDARTLIQGSPYERLQLAAAYKERSDALTLLTDASKLLRRHVSPAAVKQLAVFLDTYEHIQANGNIRLWLAKAVLS